MPTSRYGKQNVKHAIHKKCEITITITRCYNVPIASRFRSCSEDKLE